MCKYRSYAVNHLPKNRAAAGKKVNCITPKIDSRHFVVRKWQYILVPYRITTQTKELFMMMALPLTSLRAQVTTAYHMAYSDPLTLRMGERVTVVARDTEWPAYVWCTSATGKGGWVPVRYLAIDGATGRALREYSARELTVAVGELLSVLDEEGGWYWAENGCGERGWVPSENVTVIEQ